MSEAANPMALAQRLAKGAQLPRRFYKAATVGEEGGLRVVKLDGRTARTPKRSPLAFADAVLADAVMAEWEAQAELIDPMTMPLTRIVNAAFDGVAGRMAETAADIAAYAGSDLLSYRAESPLELVARQEALWDPVLAWAAEALGVRLEVGAGIVPVRQPPDTVARITAAVEPFDALGLAALHVATTLTGSAILALAVARRHLSAEEAWTAAGVDEGWQAAQWGEDAEAAARRAARRREMAAAALILDRTGR